MIHTVAVPLLAMFGTAKADVPNGEFYDADVPVRTCEAYEFISKNNRRSIITKDNSAAIVSWRQSSADSGIYVNFTALVPPEGLELSQSVGPQSIEIRACWTVQRIRSKDELPPPLPDAEQVFELKCKPAPRRLKEKMPQLSGDTIRVYPQQQHINVLGMTLPLTPHAGRRYVAVSKEIAITVDKDRTDYTTLLPSGWKYTGECGTQ